MKVATQQKRLPELRFPEFEREWERKKLGQISNDVMYGMNAAATSYDGINKYLRITDIDEANGKFKPKPLTSPKGEIEEKFVLKNGDIVFARTGASVGKPYLYDKNDGRLIFAGFLIKFNISLANPLFIYSQTLGCKYKKWVSVFSMRSGQPGLNAEEYKSLELILPNLPEQQKIASFLTRVDEKIEQLTRKAELLAAYKKGIMQQIFSQDIRFKDDDGNDFSEWEEKRLGDLCVIVTGNKDTQNRIEEGLYPFFVRSQTVQRIDSFAFDGEAILTSGDGVGVGKNYHYINGKFDFHQRVYCLRNFISEIYGKYLFYYFSEHFYKRVIRMSAKNSVDSVRRSMITDMSIPKPSLKEQTKIANFLQSLDQKIEKVQDQITQAQTWKRGLLQKMFV